MKYIITLFSLLIIQSTFAQFIPDSLKAMSFKINTVISLGTNNFNGADTIVDVTEKFQIGTIIIFRVGKEEIVGINRGPGDKNLVFIGYIKPIKKKKHWRNIPGKLYKFTDGTEYYKNVKLIIDVDVDTMDENAEPSYVFAMYFEDGVSLIFFVNIINLFPVEKITF